MRPTFFETWMEVWPLRMLRWHPLKNPAGGQGATLSPCPRRNTFDPKLRFFPVLTKTILLDNFWVFANSCRNVLWTSELPIKFFRWKKREQLKRNSKLDVETNAGKTINKFYFTEHLSFVQQEKNPLKLAFYIVKIIKNTKTWQKLPKNKRNWKNFEILPISEEQWASIGK